MFSFDIDDKLKKKIKKLIKKDKVLVQNFNKKVKEFISQNSNTISTYRNLKSSLNEFKGIHLSDNIIMLFKVDLESNIIIFYDICHRDKAYS
jgi:mRNA-degrading endonuclease RelE of RelBE toxin-antitoxin system